MKPIYIIIVVIILLVFLAVSFLNNNSKVSDKKPINKNTSNKNTSLTKDYNDKDVETIYLAGGCFWGVEAYMKRVEGVVDVTSGYANGNTENPSYEDVIYKKTGHAETVEVKYDPKKIKLEEILLYYFKVVDPTSLNKQGNDRGTQYRSGIYYTDKEQVEKIKEIIAKEQKKYTKKIVVEVLPLDNFYKAEEYHQDYLNKNPGGYCHINLNDADTGIEKE